MLLVVGSIWHGLQRVEHGPHLAVKHVAQLSQSMLLIKRRLRNQTFEQSAVQRQRKRFRLVVAHEVGVAYDVGDGGTSSRVGIQHPVDEQHEGHVVGT